MARFYDGQPVVCISDFAEFRAIVKRQGFELIFPARGSRYTVAGYHDASYLYVAEIPRIQHYNNRKVTVFWGEGEFAPITDDQVRGIIEEANRMGPWTGGTTPAREREDA